MAASYEGGESFNKLMALADELSQVSSDLSESHSEAM
jgi:hypothetical protein